MNNRTTILLFAIVIIIFAVIGVGFATSQPQAPAPTQPQRTEPPLPSTSELAQILSKEQPAITTSMQAKFPKLQKNYTIERAKLYHRGEWYGAILQYKGTEPTKRDTLRIVMQKKKGEWIVRTNPPQLLVNKIDIPEAPQSMLNDINKPAYLPGSTDSPAITPSE